MPNEKRFDRNDLAGILDRLKQIPDKNILYRGRPTASAGDTAKEFKDTFDKNDGDLTNLIHSPDFLLGLLIALLARLETEEGNSTALQQQVNSGLLAVQGQINSITARVAALERRP